jgi:hypothetical protein
MRVTTTLILCYFCLAAACVQLLAADERPTTGKSESAHGGPAGLADLQIGDRAPDFSLPGVDGENAYPGRLRDRENSHCGVFIQPLSRVARRRIPDQKIA